MKPVKLSDLSDAIEMHSEDHIVRFDMQEGCLVLMENYLLTAIEEDDKEELADLPEWQEEMIPLARAILEDDGTRFIDPPDPFEFHEYSRMEEFIQTLEDEEVANQLWRAIKGRGAFRYFKDTARELGVIEQWYAYRDNAIREFVIEWAEENNIPYEDDMKK